MIQKIKALLLVSRPISWPNTAYPFAAGYLVSGGQLDATFLCGTLYFLIPYNLLMYGINDIFDYESDIRNPRKGGIEGAREQKALHPLIAYAAVLSNVPFVVWLLITGGIISNSVLIVLLFFVVAYSLKYLRFKEIPLLDSITSSIHFVGPLVFALALHGFSAQYAPYVAAFFLWGIASHAFGAIQDIMPDRSAGISSVATVFGAKTTARLVCFLYLASSAILMTQGLLPSIVGIVGPLYAANTIPYTNIADADAHRANRAWRRFIWLNLFAGFVVTITLLVSHL